MAKVLNHGKVQGFHGKYVERRDEVKLEDALIEAARDGKDEELLLEFAQGDSTEEGFGKLMRSILYLAFLNEHSDIIKLVLGVNPNAIEFYDKSLFGYKDITAIQAELLGDSAGDVADESST